MNVGDHVLIGVGDRRGKRAVYVGGAVTPGADPGGFFAVGGASYWYRFEHVQAAIPCVRCVGVPGLICAACGGAGAVAARGPR